MENPAGCIQVSSAALTLPCPRDSTQSSTSGLAQPEECDAALASLSKVRQASGACSKAGTLMPEKQLPMALKAPAAAVSGAGSAWRSRTEGAGEGRNPRRR